MITISEEYTIRAIREGDLKMLLDWRNSERIRSVMLTNHEIKWDEHYNWFKRNEHNNPSRNLIFEYKGSPIGYIGYTEYDEAKRSCSPGCYLGEEKNVPMDAGFILFITAVDYAFKVLRMEILRTAVFKKNKKVVRVDKLLGYMVVETEQVEKDGNLEDIYIMEMHAKNWHAEEF